MSSDGLSLGYRILWRLRKAVMSVFGPAQLGGQNDPHVRLDRERSARIAEAKAKKASRSQ